jgi:hypothetical protein
MHSPTRWKLRTFGEVVYLGQYQTTGQFEPLEANMAIRVAEFTVPRAGIDVVNITIEETYDVEGIGSDTVVLRGTLVANRGAPLLERPGNPDWDTSTVVAQFTKLSLVGESRIFGPVSVSLDERVPAFGVVTGGKCKAALGVEVSLPNHDLVLRSSEPVQLQSEVRTVPPIGDERTESIQSTRLIDARSGRPRGVLTRARVMWRELTEQTEHRIHSNAEPDVRNLQAQMNELRRNLEDLRAKLL